MTTATTATPATRPSTACALANAPSAASTEALAACAQTAQQPLLLSHTGALAVTRCPNKFYLAYRLHWRCGGISEPPTIGSATHAGCEAARATGALDAALIAGDAEVTRLLPEGHDPEATERIRSMVSVLVGGYMLHLFRPDLRSIHAELDLVYPLLGPVHAKGRCDGVILRLGKDAVLYELKTTSETLDDKEAELRCGYQLPLYTWLLEQAHGVKVAGAIAEILKKPVKSGEGAVRKRKEETWSAWRQRVAQEYAANPQRYFRRVSIPRSELDTDKCIADMGRVALAVQLYEAAGYPAIRGGCHGPYGPCEYKRLCWYGDTEGYEQRPYEFDGALRPTGVAVADVKQAN